MADQDQILTTLKNQFRNLDPQLPLALFPVRLQVRFATPNMVADLEAGNEIGEDLVPADPSELWVRIYPDEIFVHSHEAQLNEEEKAAARDYWEALWQSVAAGDEEADRRRNKQGAWDALVGDYGPVRARWILRETQPVSGVDADGFPTAEPVLPALDLTQESWNEAPRTYLLPDRFLLRMERNGTVREFAGNRIEKQEDALILGIDPGKDEAFTDTPTGRNLPEEIRWLTDFQRAVDIGMGLRIPLTTGEVSGFDRLYVLGWLSDTTAADTVTLLETLFENHRYKAGGMDLAAPGTATNNTRESTVAPGPDERSGEESLGLGEEAAGDDPRRLAEALGLPATTFAGLDHSGLSSIRAGLDIHSLLFDATLGLAVDFWQNDLTAARRQLRDYMAEWVSGRGLLPALRIDDQPYSFLPAVPFSHYKTNPALLGDDFLQGLWTQVLSPLDNWFARQVEEDRVPHMSRELGPQNVQTAFLSILQLHPTSVAYRQRFALNRDFFTTNPDDLPDELKVLEQKVAAAASQFDEIRSELNAIGFPEPAALAQIRFDDRVYALAGPDEDVLLGVAGEVIPPLGQGEQNYLEWLADPSTSLDDIRDEEVPGGEAPRAVLYRLLRYRLLQSNGDALVRDRIGALAALPVADLRLLVQEHLDCCTYRLDAWLGGLAGKRLAEVRQARPQGVHLGAWGYLENIRPRNGVTHRGEYIPAPSLRHATAAAVLRSGFQANQFSGTDGAQGLFAVNLSSSRVRDALFLLEGIRNGQDLAALLGYRLERAMQEFQDAGGVPILAALIYDLRQKYPLSVEPQVDNVDSAPAEVKEDISQHVINGLEILRDQENWQTGLAPAPDAAQLAAMEPLLTALDGNLDSVRDLLASESVYQLVDGQMDRAKAALDAITEGDRIVTTEIAEIPRSSLPLTFRMGVVLPDAPLPVTGGAPLSPRALVGAKANRWLFDKLPDMSFIRVRVRWQTGADTDGNPVFSHDSFLLRNLLVEPIDLVYMMHLQRENPDTSELRYRIERLVRQRNDLPLTQRIEVLDRDRTGFNDNEYTLFALEPLAAGLGKLLLETRSLRPEDFLQPNAEGKAEAARLWEPGFLRRQLQNVTLQMENNQERFGAVLAGIRAQLDRGEDLDEVQLERSLRSLHESMFFYAGLGWVHAAPTQIEALNRLTLEAHHRRADNLFREAASKMDAARELLSPGSSGKLSSLLNSLPAGDPQEAVDTLEEVVSLLFGRFYKVYPDFRLPGADQIRQALRSPELEASQANFAVDRWLQTQAPVRPRMDLYYRAGMLSELMGRAGEMKGTDLIQLPVRDGKTGPWVGQEYGDFQPHPDTLAMTLELQQDFDLDNVTFSGILVDDWTELVPDPIANAGIALQYDQPDMEAPNAVLLALTHAPGINWEWDNLVRTVADTMLMAKKRAVDPDLLKESFWDQLSPGLLGPIFTGTEDGDSLNFGHLPADAADSEIASRSLDRPTMDLSELGLDGVDLGNVVE